MPFRITSQQLVQRRIDLQTIVTGTGRCGTFYISKFLTALGYTCSHEAIFNVNGQTDKKELLVPYTTNPDPVMADSSFMAAPFLEHIKVYHPLETPGEQTIVHLIREPIRVINSFVQTFKYFTSGKPENTKYNAFQLFIFKHVPELKEDMDPYERAALFYIRWNYIIEENSKGKKYLRHKIEDNPYAIADFLGIKKSFINLERVEKNKGDTKDLADHIPEGKIKDKLRMFCEEYHYIV